MMLTATITGIIAVATLASILGACTGFFIGFEVGRRYKKIMFVIETNSSEQYSNDEYMALLTACDSADSSMSISITHSE